MSAEDRDYAGLNRHTWQTTEHKLGHLGHSSEFNSLISLSKALHLHGRVPCGKKQASSWRKSMGSSLSLIPCLRGIKRSKRGKLYSLLLMCALLESLVLAIYSIRERQGADFLESFIAKNLSHISYTHTYPQEHIHTHNF